MKPRESELSLAMKIARKDIETLEKRERYTISVTGCKRVGLLTACLFVEAGFVVIGVDFNQRVVNLLKRRRSPFSDPQLHAFMNKQIENRRFSATTSARKAASRSDVLVINVQPSVDKQKIDYSQIEKTCREVGMSLRLGCLIIFQSAMGPGVTETFAREILENASGLKAGKDFGLAYCATVAKADQTLDDITSSTRVVGAVNKQSLNAACLIIGAISEGEIVRVKDIKTAEAVKLFGKVYQDINVAVANEFAHFCEKVGIDFSEVRNYANRDPRHPLQAAGITNLQPLESYLLLEEGETMNVKLRMLTLARKINDETLDRTLHLVRDALRSCRKTLRRASISILGVSSLPNTKETLGSPTKKLVKMLKKRGVSVQVYDPFFSHKELSRMGYPAKATLTKTIEGADCLIIAVGHDRFRRLNLKRTSIFVKKPAAIVDIGDVINPAKAEKEGFLYRGLGRGVWTR